MVGDTVGEVVGSTVVGVTVGEMFGSLEVGKVEGGSLVVGEIMGLGVGESNGDVVELAVGLVVGDVVGDIARWLARWLATRSDLSSARSWTMLWARWSARSWDCSLACWSAMGSGLQSDWRCAV